MTHSMANCQIAYEAHDDHSLGLFYADNGFVPQLETLPESIFKWLDYSKIGKELREAEGGVFTPNGYVVQNGEIAQAYQSGAAIHTEKPDYTVLLKVNKGCFNDPDYDNELTALLKLPADDKALFSGGCRGGCGVTGGMRVYRRRLRHSLPDAENHQRAGISG